MGNGSKVLARAWMELMPSCPVTSGMVQKSRGKSNPPISRALKVQGLGPMEIAVLVKDAALACNTY
jgi:hypothetical protein